MNEVLTLFQNSTEKWIIAICVGVGVWFSIQYVRKLWIARLENPSEGSATVAFFRDLLVKTPKLFIWIVAIYSGFSILELGPRVNFFLNKGLVITAIIQLGMWIHRLLTFALEQREVKMQVDTMLAKGAINTINTILRVILWSLIGLLLLGNLGVKIEPLVAGLGIGGIAIALGVQQTLQDVAASLSILFDKPFVVGDYIVVGDFLGTVECIGIKTTRMLSLTGEQIIFSNNDLLNSRIRNYKKMVERRILFTFRIPYDTAYDKVCFVPLAIKKIIESKSALRFDRAHLKQFGEYAFEFEVVYYVRVPEYNVYMDLQQQINFAIIQCFEEQAIAFAFPKQIVVLDQP
jgi:small-conductance mechanosensitive channel